MTQDFPDWLPIGFSLSDQVILANGTLISVGGTLAVASGVTSVTTALSYLSNIQPYIVAVTVTLPQNLAPPNIVRIQAGIACTELLSVDTIEMSGEGGSFNWVSGIPIFLHDARVAPPGLNHQELHITWWGGFAGALNFGVSLTFLQQKVA